MISISAAATDGVVSHLTHFFQIPDPASPEVDRDINDGFTPKHVAFDVIAAARFIARVEFLVKNRQQVLPCALLHIQVRFIWGMVFLHRQSAGRKTMSGLRGGALKGKGDNP